MPNDIIMICPAAFSELLFELFVAGGKMKLFLKDWDLFFLIHIHKRKRLRSVSDNNRPLLLILILQKILEMETTVKLMLEFSDELGRNGFNGNDMDASGLRALRIDSPAGSHKILRPGSVRPGHGHRKREA